ncbi:MAG: VCBS repeat-containing protein [Gemmataceae bacterium]
MARISLPKLFRKLAFKPDRKRGFRNFPLFVEDIEDRIVPATLPQPTLVTPTAATATSTAAGFFNPQVVASPTNVQNQVMAAMSGTTVLAQISTNAGSSWSTVGNIPGTLPTDPTITPNPNPVPYSQASGLSVAYGRDGTLYFVYLVHNADKTSGAVMFRKATFGSAAGAPVMIYQWTGNDPALNPTIAVDNNLPNDPLLSTTDTMIDSTTLKSKGVYIAWNGNATPAGNGTDTGGLNLNTGAIMGCVSGDDGATWSVPAPISDNGFASGTASAAPQIVFAPANSGRPGSLIYLWPTQGGTIMYDSTRPDGGVAGNVVAQAYSTRLIGQTGPFADAVSPPSSPPPPPNTPDIQQSQDYTLNVATAFPGGLIPTTTPAFVTRDMSLQLKLTAPHLEHLKVELIRGAFSVTLFTNRLDGLGATRTDINGIPVGLPANSGSTTGIGRLSSGSGVYGAVFDDQGARSIVDNSITTTGYIGMFRPEDGTNMLAALGLAGASAATINAATFTLRVTDFKNDGSTAPTQSVDSWGLTFSSIVPGMGTDGNTGLTGTTIGADPTSGAGSPNKPAISPTVGIPGSISVAFDNTLGNGTGANGGQMYLALTTGTGSDTNVAVSRGSLSAAGVLTMGTAVKVNDDRLADNYTEGDRAQFIPAVTVDSYTGTVVATWYDARLDANNTRAATFVATSIDGGASWSDQTYNTAATSSTNGVTNLPFLSQPKIALDVITNRNYTLQPVPSNIPQAGANGIGIRQSVIAAAGHIYAYWGGNSNAAGTSIMSAHAVTAVGPRITSGDMGSVTSLSSFTVTFDRPMGPVTTASAELRYHNPYDNATVFTTIPITGVSQSGNSYTFTFPTQTAIGTYSYVVRPTLLKDTVWHMVSGVPTLGNTMDQDADAVSGEIDVDSFAMPTPTNGIPYQFPFNSSTLPLMIAGPRMNGSSVPGYANSLVLGNNVATQVDVTFDTDINQNPAFGPVFTNANIIRMTGPAGVVYDRATATTNPMVVTPLTARSYRITFPGQALSGTYTIEIDPYIVSTTLLPGGANRYAYIDTNRNAGLDVLRGGSPTTGVATNSTYNAAFNASTTPTSTIPAASGAVPSMKEYPLTVPNTESFLIALSTGHQIEVQLNVSSSLPDNTNVVNLSGELVAPDGTVVRLFTNVGNGTRPPGTLWFSNTLFNDTGNTPIQVGFQPFDSGPYNPQFPLGNLAGKLSSGTWKLRIFNAGTSTPDLTGWSLSLPQISGGTGLGEANADRFAVSFRVFNQDPTSALTQRVWTAVGPAPENGPGGNTARMNAIAVDPSDPSGNTVYVGAASGGLWKTNNFLTQNANGPTYVPLGDGAPAYGLNVVSIAVFPRNNDPLQSIIFALTGEGDTGTPGVGVLRSMDGGRTWNVLDSTNNTDSPTVGSGVLTSISSPTRDRGLFGVTGFKVVVDPTAVNNADKDVIVYIATGSGVWRSTDTGRHWTRLKQGVATDVVLAEGSAAKVGNPNLQVLYAAFRDDGIYKANPAYVAASMVFMSGSPGGNGSYIQGDDPLQNRVSIAQPADKPNGAAGKDRIMLATPALTNNALQDLNYQGWLYALVVSDAGALDGLYITKDFGDNWTSISLAERLVNGPTGAPIAGYGTNNYTRNDHDIFASPPGTSNPLPGQGKYDIGFAIDPNNPNVVYMGGMTQSAIGPNGGLIRVDITGLQDAQAIVAYDNSATVSPAGGPVQLTANSGNVTVKNPGSPYGVGYSPLPLPNGSVAFGGVNNGLLNVYRNPAGPFATSPLLFGNVTSINNKGWGARYAGFGPAEVQTDIHRILAVRDQVTGKTRIIVEDDQGIGTALDDGQGNVLNNIGGYTLPGVNRNGNLQIIQFYSSTAQPGQLAAEIASAMFYGEAQDDGFPVSSDNILQTGGGALMSWSGSAGDGSWGLTDQTGTGTYYDYRWPCCGGGQSNFFRVGGISRTFGLLQPGDNPTLNQGQWPFIAGFKFAVNPIDGNGIMISNNTSRIFRTVDQGVTWTVVADPNLAGYTNVGSYAQALAFGSPDPTFPDQFNNYLLAGTSGGQVWVTYTGGSPWTNISAGLSGGAVQQIIPDPTRGSRAAYAVTSGGVFFKADTTPGAAPWVNITGNLFSRSKPIFDDPNAAPKNGVPAMMRNLTSLAVDWRYSIPVDPLNPSAGSYPVLYVGGYGGVVRSLDRGATWQTYPVGTTYTYTDPITSQPVTINTPDGGYLPSVEVTQLTLSQGNIDPATGQPIQQTGGLNMLTAATYGRGTWVIRLGTPENDPAIAAITQYQVVKQSGPRVIAVTPISTSGSQNTIRVQFDSPVLASTFTTADVQLRDANGTLFTINSVTALGDTVGPFAPYRVAIPAGVFVGDYHDRFDIVVTRPGSYTPFAGGFAEVVIGEKISDYAGFAMNQNDNFLNGEGTADPNNGGYAADAYHGYLVLGASAPAGNLHIDQPMVATAGEPTRVVISAMNAGTGRPNAGYTGTITMDATVNGRRAVLTNLPVFQIKDLTADVSGNVTATTLVPLSADIVPGRRIVVGGVGTAAYNTTDPTGDLVISVAADRLSFVYQNAGAAGAPVDRTGGGNVTGPFVPVATTSPNPAPYPAGLLPSTYTYTAADAGTKVFAVFYIGASGPPSQTLLSVSGTGGVASAMSYVTVQANRARQFVLQGVSPTTAGDTHQWTLKAVDQYGNIDTKYTGTVTITSDDPQATIAPNSYTFTSLDAGVKTLNVTLRTAGLITLTATDAVTNAPAIISGTHTVRVMPATPTTITVSGFPSPTVAGVAHDYTVSLFDAFGNLATNYAGTVTMTNNDPYTGPGAHFNPASYTFTAYNEYTPAIEDAGTHTFTGGATLYTAGPRSIIVSDTSLGISGAQVGITVVAAPMSQFVVSGFPSPTAAGTSKTFTVRAADPYGNRISGYTGKVQLTTSDAQGSFVPASGSYTFTVGDAGQRTFTANLKTAGSQSITVTDVNTPSLTGTQSGIIITPLAASTVQVTGLTSPRQAGVDGDFTVTFRDIYNNIATGYVGNVVFSSTDPQATFSPSSYSFTLANAGQRTFVNGANLKTVGTWNIRATAGALVGTQNNIVVTPAPATVAVVTGHTTPVVAGTPSDFTVEFRDPYGNRDTNFAGNVVFSSNDPQAVFSPPNYTYTTGSGGDNGIHTFLGGSTLKTAGNARSITATSGAIVGTQSPIVVTPNVATHFVVDQYPSSTIAGVANNFRVTARDAYGNVATGYLGSVTFTSDDPQAAFSPTSHTFTAGDAGVFIVSGTLKTAGTRSITASDGSISGTQSGITVAAAATSKFTMNFPSPTTAGVGQSFTVRATDAYGNTTPTYTGIVTLTSSDIQAVFDPSNVIVFGVSNNGAVTLPGELRTAGSQSITANDGTFTGTQSGIVVTPNVAYDAVVSGFPASTVAGVAHNYTVTVRDVYGNTATGYTGTMTLYSSDDSQATFAPSTHTFTATDAGVYVASATLKTAGTRSITAIDGSITGTQGGITVIAAAASRVDVTGFPSSTTAGIAHDFTVTLYDPFNNVATGFTGTMTFTSDDAQASLPAPYAFTGGDAGTHTFTNGATLRTAGTRFIRGTSGALVGTQSGITVNAAAMSKFVVEGFQSPITAGVSDLFTVRATDAFNNTTSGYTGTVTLSSSDPLASFSPSATLNFTGADLGSKNVTGTLRTAGSQSITASDSFFSGSQTGIQVTPAAASQVIVSAFPATITAGVAGSFTVTLRDPFNNVATGYTGTVTFTSSDGQATFSPASYPFTPGDAGVKTFLGGATLRTAGTQSITASDGSISGSQTGILVTPAATSQFLTNFPTPVTAGAAQSFTVRAADAYGNTTPTYTGNVTLTSNDPQATFSLSNPIAFSGSDLGVRSLTGTLRTAGTRSISATDGTFSGTQNGIVVNAAAPAAVVVSGVNSPTTAGIARTFTVSIRDAFNNVATSYLGTMTFSSSDGQVVFAPVSHTFTATDAGQRTFPAGVTLKTAGTQTVVATDSVNSLSGFQSVTVTPATASQAIVSGFPGSTVAGVPHDFTVTMLDPFNNVATGYTGTVSFSSNDVQASFAPTSHTFTGGDAGVHTFTNGATLRTAGTRSISVTDGTITGSQTNITVTPAATAKFVTNFPSPTTAGVAQGFTVRATDAFGNTTPTYTGTATIGTDDAQAGFSSTTVPFTVADNGVRPITGTLRTAGNRSISVTDGTFSGTQSGIQVVAANATSLVVFGFPSPTVAGVAHSFTVTAYDPFNNVATGYTGTVTFTSNDPQGAFLPPNFAFTPGDGGTHTFVNGATLKTAGTRTITASDGTLSGTQSNIQVNPAAAASLNITGFPNSVRATDDQPFTVTARDAFNNVATGYTGTVAFTSTDPFGTFVPGPYAFTGTDAGVHVFTGNLSTNGLQSFTVQDTGNGVLTATRSNIAVTPGPVASFTLTGAPSVADGGTSFPLTVRALDRFGRPLTTYNGAVVFSSSDPYATLPSGVTLVNGVATVNVTLFTPAVRSISVRDSVNAAANGTVNVTVDGGVLQPAIVTHRFAVGAGGGSTANLYEADGTFVRAYQPFGPGFTGGIRVSVADYNLDGIPDVVLGSGPGIIAQVKVYDGATNAVLLDLQPFADFTGGVFVSSGAIKGDGFPDMIVTPDRGGGPRVSIFHGPTFNKIADFYGIDDPDFRGGARAAAGDFNGDGKDDVIVSAGFLGGPRIALWDGAALLNGLKTRMVGDFYAFLPDLRDGAYVAAGDVNGDGIADAIFGAGPGGGPRTNVIDGRALLANPTAAIANPVSSFFTGDYTQRGGIRESIKNIDGDQYADLIVGDGENVGSSVRVYLGKDLKDGSIGREFSFRAFPEVNAGVFVG